MKHVDHSTKSTKCSLVQDPHHTNSIKRWFKNFMETGSILDRKRSGRPSIVEETVDAMCVAFHRSPRKSIRVASNKLAISRSTVEKFYINDFGSMLTSYKLFKLLSRMIIFVVDFRFK